MSSIIYNTSIHHAGKPTCIQGGPERTQHLRSIVLRKLGTELKSCVHYGVYNSFPSKMTPRSLILMKAFGFYGHFSEAMSFSKFATSISKVTIVVPNISIVWLPRVKCLFLLCKTKTAWIKRSIHYITLQCYIRGELLKEIPPYLNRDFWYKRSKFWKWHCLRKMALESKRLHQNNWSWCHFVGKRILYTLMHSLIWFSPWFEMSDRRCPVLSGPPCITSHVNYHRGGRLCAHNPHH